MVVEVEEIPEVRGEQREVGAQLVGYDPREQTWFHRELPFAPERIEALQPRLKNAAALAREQRIDWQNRVPGSIDAFVAGSRGEHRVRQTVDGYRCTCHWFAKHGLERGPCRHILAVQLGAAEHGETP